MLSSSMEANHVPCPCKLFAHARALSSRAPGIAVLASDLYPFPVPGDNTGARNSQEGSHD